MRSAISVAVILLTLSGWAVAAEPPATIVEIAHVDFVPQGKAPGEALLRQLAVASRKEPGCLSFQVLRQRDRDNHFTLVEIWRDQQAVDAHEAAAHTRQFRDQAQQFLGSPFDERLHQVVE